MPLAPLQRSTVRRTLARFWDVTRMRPGIAALAVILDDGRPRPRMYRHH